MCENAADQVLTDFYATSASGSWLPGRDRDEDGEIISHAVWLYHRFGVSFRDVEDLLAQRGITVSYEAIRLWCLTFGSAYARRLKRRQRRLGDTWHLDEALLHES